MEEYSKIWKSLDEEAAKAGIIPGHGILRRRVDHGAPARMYFAVFQGKSNRLLLIHVPAGYENLPEFPVWRGMNIEVVNEVDTGDQQQRCISMMLVNPVYKDIFEAVISDICVNISKLRTDEVMQGVMENLKKWQTFFEKFGYDGLSNKLQQGLYGELQVIRDYLIPKIGPMPAIVGWTGGEHALHDFQFPRVSVEVKTSSANHPQNIHISSERQLDDAGLDALFLLVISLSVMERSGETLPEIIDDIRGKINDYPSSMVRFEELLIGYGYLDTHAAKYNKGYYARSVAGYRVKDGFPRILEKNLPVGIGDVSYSVSLSACEEYKIDAKIILDTITLK